MTAATTMAAPLTLDEQSRLAVLINHLPPKLLVGVVEIIRQDDFDNYHNGNHHQQQNEQEHDDTIKSYRDNQMMIDMDMDQLSISTQRKLFHYVANLPIRVGAKRKSGTRLQRQRQQQQQTSY